ncbi:MAG: hypothetical protein R2716_10440 [Microthrixaceae bacterium]
MSGDQQKQRNNKSQSGSTKGKRGGSGGQKRNKKRRRKKQNKSAIDPNRPLWENPGRGGRSRDRRLGPSAHHPTAVRSSGTPAGQVRESTAQHYYDAVYEKAQQCAVAIATANGLLMDEDDDSDADEQSDAGSGGSPCADRLDGGTLDG